MQDTRSPFLHSGMKFWTYLCCGKSAPLWDLLKAAQKYVLHTSTAPLLRVSAKASQRQLWGSACRETLCATLNPSWRPLLHSTVALPVLQGQRNLTPRYSHFQEHKLTLKAEEKFQSLEQQFYFPCHSCSLSEQNSGSSHNLFIVPCCARLLLHLL